MADSQKRSPSTGRRTAKAIRTLRVAFAVDDAGSATAGIRALTLALLVAFVFAVLGTLQFAKPPKVLAKSPFDMDLAFRAVSLGWFDSDRTIPVTIVDIDEQTHSDWNAPAVTPRASLRTMLEGIVSDKPLAIVVDIDLAQGGPSPDAAVSQGEEPLLGYLRQYEKDPPLIFPKRLEPGPGGERRPADSPYDKVIHQNPQLSWAHANLESERGGIVRWYTDWWTSCPEGRPISLPSIAVQVSTLLANRSDHSRPRDKGGIEAVSSCKFVDPRYNLRHRILVGPRITGAGRMNGHSDAVSIPARMLLDPSGSRVEPGLFNGRVVLIGSSHSAAGDNWLTPAGVYPGVELLANSIRFVPLQTTNAGLLFSIGSRAGALLLFAMFALFDWRFRPVIALFATIAGTLAFLALLVGFFDDYSAFDVIESAILLALVYKALKTAFDFIADVKAQRQNFPGGWRGSLMTFRAACLREPH